MGRPKASISAARLFGRRVEGSAHTENTQEKTNQGGKFRAAVNG